VKTNIFFIFFSLISTLLLSQPTSFQLRGIGGGGAMFSPSINPENDQEIYYASDLGGLYQTTSGGNQYDVVPFWEAITGVNSKVCFTMNPLIRYVIKYDISTTDQQKRN
jgi:hypothetical protein